MSHATALERAQLVVTGVRSELRLEHGRVEITKEATTQPRPTVVRFTIDAVRGTSIGSPGRGGRGWLHVAVVGGSPPPPTELAAASDPYTLPLTSRGVGRARRFARLVDEHVRARGLPSEDAGAPSPATTGVSVVAAPMAEPAPVGVTTPARASVTAPDGAPRGPAEGAPARSMPSAVRSRHREQLAELRAVGILTHAEHDRAVARLEEA